jgi:hypothetical protein
MGQFSVDAVPACPSVLKIIEHSTVIHFKSGVSHLDAHRLTSAVRMIYLKKLAPGLAVWQTPELSLPKKGPR